MPCDNILTRMHPERSDASELTVTCPAPQYSASQIARAVEDCDAHLLNLDVTADVTADGDTIIELRVSHRNADAVARSLARYGYTVTDIRNAIPDTLADSARDRINSLLRELTV